MTAAGVEIVTLPNTIASIDRVWMFISIDQNGNEGLLAAPYGPGGMLLPLIAADEGRLKGLTKWAELIARNYDGKVKLIEMSTRTELRDLTESKN